MANVMLEMEERIALIRIDHPPYHVLNHKMTEKLADCVRSVKAAEDISVMVITGSGTKAFMSGADIKEFPELRQQRKIREMVEMRQKLFAEIEQLPIPTIAAVNGLALGAGLELALSCDFIIADQTAKFSLPEIKLGLIPGGGGTQRLPRRVGVQTAYLWMATGEMIGMEEAYQHRLVDRVAPSHQALEEALSLAKQLAEGPRAALQSLKTLMNNFSGVHFEREKELFEQLSYGLDAEEGIQAFMEKRKPRFASKGEGMNG